MYSEDSPIFQDPEERKHFYQHLTALNNYTEDAAHLFRERSMPAVFNDPFYFQLFNGKCKRVKELVQMNQNLLDQMIPFRPQEVVGKASSHLNKVKLMSTLKQFYREWSEESTERHLYKRLVDRLKEFMPTGKVLLPGCGLGRSVLEFVKVGFAAQGNQVSYFMLLGSDFILNQVTQRNSVQFAPFVHCTEGNLDDTVRLSTVKIPDALACEDISADSDFSMTSGDFLQVYGKQKQEWDCVCTCYFIDTANNVLLYVDLIAQLLRKGGVWLNYGPLLYHYHDQLNEISVQLSWQSLRQYLLQYFQLASETIQPATYCHVPNSTSTCTYQCVYFSAIRK